MADDFMDDMRAVILVVGLAATMLALAVERRLRDIMES